MVDPSIIKEKALSGFIWSMTENSGSYFLHFLIGLVLVRLIEPTNYGIIGMMTFFISFSSVLTDFGLSTTLIQKKEPTDEDFSTTLITNVSIALVLYIVTFSISGLIADFYSQPEIETALKVFALNFVFSAIGIVQGAKINRSLNYKLWTRINLTSLAIAGVTAITIASYGYGLWALVFIQLTQNVSNVIQMWIFGKWDHGYRFSINSLKQMTSFSKPIVFISAVNNIYTEAYNILVGRLFRAEQLAYYIRAKQTSEIFALQFTATMNKVMLPVMSHFQKDEVNLRASYHKVIIITGLINFSVLAFLASNAESIFVLLYTDRWLFAVPLFQFLCIDAMFMPLQSMSGNLLIARGKSKYFMYIELVKRVIQAGIIIISLNSLEYIVYGQIFTSTLFTLVGFWVVSKEIEYKISEQIKVIIPYLILAIIVFLSGFLTIEFIHLSYLPGLILNLFISVSLYASISYIFKLEAFDYFIAIFNDRLKKLTKRK